MDKIPLIEKDIQTMSDAIKEVKSEMKNHREDMNAHRQDFQAFKEELFERLENKFASKWVEKFVVWWLWIVWVTIIWAIMSLIIK